MLSKTHDEGRVAYARGVTKRARRNIFFGTTNNIEFLEDITGGRRFLPIQVMKEIDLNWMRTNIRQLVGEACARQSRGERIHQLPRDIWDVAGEHQEAARINTAAEIKLRSWYEPSVDEPVAVHVRATDIVDKLIDAKLPTNSFGPIMRKLGYRPERQYFEIAEKQMRVRIWVRGEFKNSVDISSAKREFKF
jgi:hypothetical protein